MRAQLDADLALVLKRLPSIEIETTTPKSFRELLRSLAAASGVFPLPSVQSIEDISVKGAAGALKARVYRPTAEVSPTVVFFHGGGCVGGDIETHDRSARRLAIETGDVVISVDYRLAPETRFPGAFDDALAAVHDVATRIDEFGRNAQRIGLAGDRRGRDCRCDSHRVSGQKPSRRGAAPDLSRNGHGRPSHQCARELPLSVPD